MEALSLFILVLASSAVAVTPLTHNLPECRPVDTPKRLPTVTELLDSMALVKQIAGATTGESPEILLGVAFPHPSGPPQAWVIASGVTPDPDVQLAALTQAALRPSGAQPGTTLRIRVRIAAPVGVGVERSILCAPVPVDSARSQDPGIQVTTGDGSGPPQGRRAVIRQRIGTDGMVQEARLQPGSGQPELDRLALAPAYARRWRPATLDGRPVAVWFTNGRVELAK